jgi:hypothetical protein
MAQSALAAAAAGQAAQAPAQGVSALGAEGSAELELALELLLFDE